MKVTTTQSGMPSQADQQFAYVTTPVVYSGSSFGTPLPGRNIFAFYEPPPPTPWVPTPMPTPPPPTPAPTPHMVIAFVSPQSVFAGQPKFRLEVNGDRFTPDAKIYFNQNLLPTTFVNLAKLTADIPANFIAGPGQAQVIVQTPDGKMYSNVGVLQVQPPPKPNVYYVGMISRKYGNNDTAYFVEQSKINTAGTVPESKRLNDTIGGRFRIVSIAGKAGHCRGHKPWLPASVAAIHGGRNFYRARREAGWSGVPDNFLSRVSKRDASTGGPE